MSNAHSEPLRLASGIRARIDPGKYIEIRDSTNHYVAVWITRDELQQIHDYVFKRETPMLTRLEDSHFPVEVESRTSFDGSTHYVLTDPEDMDEIILSDAQARQFAEFVLQGETHDDREKSEAVGAVEYTGDSVRRVTPDGTEAGGITTAGSDLSSKG
jgi:hypothetical protein